MEYKRIERIAFFIPDLRGAGAERAVCNLLIEMAKRDPRPALDLVLVSATGVYLKEIPAGVRIIDLGKGKAMTAIPPLVRYLRENRPCFLIANLSHLNITASIANRLAGTDSYLILVEHNILPQHAYFPGKQWFVQWLMRKLYPDAAGIVAVSGNTALNIERRLGLSAGRVQSIYNPVVSEELFVQAAEPITHPWMGRLLEGKGIPVFLGVGRLVKEKGFSMLIKAFSLVRHQRAARLIILGEGELREELESYVGQLGLQEDISMPGFARNPFAYMARCDAFVLSSLSEGLANVLIEAMACGCPVISTDCPGGPREILQDGEFGILVKVGDAEAMASAMIQTVDSPPDREKGRNRAAFFSSARAADDYLSLMAGIDKNGSVKL
jgi:glycosyltransferase involved in cell wall biosynthesis